MLKPSWTLILFTSFIILAYQNCADIRLVPLESKNGSENNLNHNFQYQKVSTGKDHSCVLIDGKVSCWGSNSYGILGIQDPSLISSPTPLNVSQLGSSVSAIDSGVEHTCALQNSGLLFCWGRNQYAQLGIAGESSASPSLVLNNVRNFSTGPFHTCAVTNEQKTFCWGRNHWGQAGNSNRSNILSPQEVIGVSNAVKVSTGSYSSCVLKDDQKVWCWGFGKALSVSPNPEIRSPFDLGISEVEDFYLIPSSIEFGFAITNNKTVYRWGGSNFGLPYVSPKALANSDFEFYTSARDSNNKCVLKKDNTVFCSGSNSEGHLGVGNSQISYSQDFTKVESLRDVVSISSNGQHACALTKNKEVYCWGRNFSGQAGSGSSSMFTPFQIL